MPTLLRMPSIAAGAETAILLEWQVQEGIPYDKSDAIATIETDKASLDMEAEEAGVIVRFLSTEGAVVEVGSAIALCSAPGETVDDVTAALRQLGVAEAVPMRDDPSSDVEKSTAPGAPTPTPQGSTERVFVTPLVRRLAREADLDLANVVGTGPNGRIVRRDVESLLAAPPKAQAQPVAEPPAATTPVAAPGASTGYTDVPVTRMRAAIAARLTESKRTTPHFYLRGSCDVDDLLALRKELNKGEVLPDGSKVSVNDLVVKAAARAHALVPAMNAIWVDDAVRQFDAVDIAVAVASANGLLTPVVRDVAKRSVTAVSAELRDLAERARTGKIGQRELEGGAICISNLGMYGTEEFSAIINPPQSAILAVGASRQEPVVRSGELAVATVMRVTLSVDHRPIDGSVAAEWMRAFVHIIENPVHILV